MGTWGVGAFENDGAGDWAEGLTSRKKPALIEKALARVGATDRKRRRLEKIAAKLISVDPDRGDAALERLPDAPAIA